MSPSPRPEIIHAHECCTANIKALGKSRKAGCFYCLAVFEPKEIFHWIRDEGGSTALCPRCGIDSVIPENAGFPLTEAFLGEMRDYWFSPHEDA